MFSKVKVNKGALNHFRKRAREAFPLEIQAYCIGRVVSVNEIEITKFVYPKEYATQTREKVQWYQAELDEVKAKAIEMEQMIIGDIHSHPSWDAVMSPSDYAACLEQAAHIAGIVSVNNGKTRARFWTPTSALPCKIIYT
jgi:proteasome lid subunit RPN8/RPN11